MPISGRHSNGKTLGEPKNQKSVIFEQVQSSATGTTEGSIADQRGPDGQDGEWAGWKEKLPRWKNKCGGHWDVDQLLIITVNVAIMTKFAIYKKNRRIAEKSRWQNCLRCA